MDYDLSLDEIKTTHLHTVEKVKLKVVSFGALPILLMCNWCESKLICDHSLSTTEVKMNSYFIFAMYYCDFSKKD